MDIPICVIYVKIRSNPKVGGSSSRRSTRMHCINQNLDNIYFSIWGGN